MDLERYGIHVRQIIRNPSPALLYESALRHERGTAIAASGALVAMSGARTGRSPADKRIVAEPATRGDVWWGDVNIELDEHTFEINRERAIDYLNTLELLYVVDGYAGWSTAHRVKVRVICARAYHALFMHNMLVRPSASQLRHFGTPDLLIINAGAFPANRYTTGMTSTTSIDLHLSRRELVILGTEYAGEMKKGLFTVMNYLLPKAGVLSMHCSATAATGELGDGGASESAILFGLSGTGKTTLSHTPDRMLIGDDEHGWDDHGIFNIEGGCYAKVVDLAESEEPVIYRALRFGAVLENVVYDARSREVAFDDISLTENTRGCYPIEFVPQAAAPCVGAHPRHVIFLACDAFGVLPPVARLTPEQAEYHFISGYSAKMAGTEVGVTEPEATFSPGFGGPFLVWHPTVYSTLLAERLRRHGSQTWLLNTGWSSGPAGASERIKLRHTRAMLDAIYSGALERVPAVTDPVFDLAVPSSCPGVPRELLLPRTAWPSPGAYDAAAARLAEQFRDNFRRYEAQASPGVRAAGPTGAVTA
jgi:phosphoenolpyruvate carboxykinase (ATP)